MIDWRKAPLKKHIKIGDAYNTIEYNAYRGVWEKKTHRYNGDNRGGFFIPTGWIFEQIEKQQYRKRINKLLQEKTL